MIRRLWIVPLLVLLAFGGWLLTHPSDAFFTVGILEEHYERLSDTAALEAALGEPVELKVYPSEQAMLPDILDGKLDVYAVSTFFWLERGLWQTDKAIGRTQTQIALVGRADSPTQGTLTIGAGERPIVTLLLGAANPLYGSIIEYRQIETNHERLAALRERQCDYVVIRGGDARTLQLAADYPVMTRMTDLGYHADLIVLRAGHVSSPKVIAAVYTAFAGAALPDASETVQVMSYLFQEKRIPRRIAYSELVVPLD